MNCEEAKILSVAHILGDLDPIPEQCRQLESHLAFCQVCAEEYKSSKWAIKFLDQHKTIFAEVLRTPEEKKAAEQEEIQRSWKCIEARLDEFEAQRRKEKQATFHRLLVRVSAVAACLAIGIFSWVAFSIYSKQRLVLKLPTPQVALVLRPSVNIELVSQNGSILIPANRQIVSTNDEFKTLVINNKHRMTMNSNTSLSVEPLEKNSNIGCLVKLDSGQIYTHVQHDGNPFIVDTAYGEAVITGTTFDIKATDSSTTVVVSEGAVQFGSDDSFVKVAAGQTSRIFAQSAPTRPILCNAAKLTAWATGYKAKPILAQVTPTKSYSDTSDLSLSTDDEPIVLEEKAEGVKTAADLIEQAHKHDAGYTLGAGVNRQKGLSLYQSALAAEPDEKQRLHILYRMAQLNGTIYRKDKGEKPNYQRAISLYKDIIDSYPPEEPLVYKATSAICDHYTTLWEFETAVKWAKKALEYDTSQMAEQLKAIEQKEQALEHGSPPMTPEEELEIREQIKQGDSLEKPLAKIRRYQEIAVDQVAYAAEHISSLYAHGELRAIIDKYHGTFIADRAHDHFTENMDKMPELWAPQNDEPFLPSGSTLQAAGPTPSAHSERQKDIQIQPNVTPDVAKRSCSVEPNITEIPQKDKHIAREPRAPPLSYLSKGLIGAAGLIVLGFAAVIIRKNNHYLGN